MWKLLCAALALANICYLHIWGTLLVRPSSSPASLRTPPSPPEYLAAIANVLLLGLAFFIAFALLQALLSRLRGRGPLASVLGRSFRITTAILTLLFPFVLFTFGQALWRILTYQPPRWLHPAPDNDHHHESARTRVLWILFDEWDYQLTFEHRPEWLELPELDRLRKTSFFATCALPPSQHTALSVLSYLTGKVTQRAELIDQDDLILTFAHPHSPPAPWSELRHLFKMLKDMGLATGVIGWYMPYCPLLAGTVSTCWWHDWTDRARLGRADLRWLMSDQWRKLLTTVRLSATGNNLSAFRHAQLFSHIIPPALEAVADPRLSFVFLHLPIPHGPHFFDSINRTLSLNLNQKVGYFHSLALVDLTLHKLLDSLQHAGLADRTVLLVTSDHWLRTPEKADPQRDWRVPFLLKFPRQRAGLVYDRPFNATIAHHLVLAILKNEIRNAHQVGAWLDARRDTLPLEPVL